MNNTILKNDYLEQLSRLLLDNVSDAIISTDQNFVINSWNKAAEKIYDLSPYEVLDRAASDLFQYEFLNDSLEISLKKLLEDGEWKGIVSLTRNDGKKVILNASVSTLKNELGETIGFVAVNRDITDVYMMKDLLQNEQRLSFALQGAGDGVWEYNFQTREVYYSAGYKKMLGFQEHEFQNLSEEWRGRIHKDDEHIVTDIEKKYDDNLIESHSIEYRLKHKGGHYVWVLDRGMVITKTDSGRPLKLIGTQTNINHQKTTEQKLVKAQQLLQSFMANTPTLNWIIDENNQFHLLNNSYMNAFHLSAEHLHKSIYDIFPPHICDAFVENNWRVWNSGAALETIEEGVGPDGSRQIYQIFKFPLGSEGGVKLLGGVGLDITANILNEQKLRLSNERYDYAGKATSDAIWDWDIKTDRIYRSESFSSLFGYDETSTSTQFKMDHIHSGDRDRITSYLKKSLDGKIERWQDEYRFECLDGSFKIVLDKGFIIRNEEGEAIRMIGAMRDVTEQRNLQEQLNKEEERKKKEVLQAIIHAQERERHEISHELHDNVSQILTTCKLLLDAALQQGDKKYMHQTSENIQKAIDEIRNISHRLNPATLTFIGLEGSINDLLNKINNTGSLTVNFSYLLDDVIKMHNDVQLAIFRIVQEQVNNIIKHADAKNAWIELSDSNGRMKLVITDDGKGYDLQAKKQGLGLRNIFNRAEFHKGTAQIFTEPGKGFKLQVQIPL